LFRNSFQSFYNTESGLCDVKAKTEWEYNDLRHSAHVFYRKRIDAAGHLQQFFISHHVSADVSVKFEYHLKDTLPFTSASKLLSENNDSKKVRDIVSSTSEVFKLFDTTYVDSILKSAFAKEGIVGFSGFGLINAENGALVYQSAAGNKNNLLSSSHRLRLNDNLFFSKPYDLTVEFKNENQNILSKITGVLVVSAVILLILISGFWYFLLTIRKQRKLSDMKSDFINNMTHEFNTPLSNISLASETLLKTHLKTAIKITATWELLVPKPKDLPKM